MAVFSSCAASAWDTGSAQNNGCHGSLIESLIDAKRSKTQWKSTHHPRTPWRELSRHDFAASYVGMA
jgi:hypothetical protein